MMDKSTNEMLVRDRTDFNMTVVETLQVENILFVLLHIAGGPTE